MAASGDMAAAPRRVRPRYITVAPVVQVLAGNSVTGITVLACLTTADTCALRRLHPAVAATVAGVPWCDMNTPVVDTVRWRAALPAALGLRVDRLPKQVGDLAAAAAALVGVTRLELHKCGSSVTTAALVHLPSSLRVLKVLQPFGKISGASFAHLTALVSLDFDAWGDIIVTSLPPSLQKLRLLTCNDAPTADFRHLVALRVLSCTTDELSIATIASLPPSLEELNTGIARWPHDIPVSLAHLPRLRALRNGYNSTIHADTIASLPSCLMELIAPGRMSSSLFSHWHVLQTVNISGSDCDDEALASLPPSLVTLDVSSCEHLSPDAVLPYLPVLTTLDLSHTPIGNALVASLPPSLVTLHIMGCHRLTHGATFDHLPALRELHFSGADLSPVAIVTCRARGCIAPADGLLLSRHGRRLTSLAVLPDGRLAGRDEGGTMRSWDVKRRGEAVLLLMYGGKGSAGVLAVLSDRLVTDVSNVGDDWQKPVKGAVLHKVAGNGLDACGTSVEGLRGAGVNSLAVLPDGRLAAGCNKGSIRVVDVDAPAAEAAVLVGHTGSVEALVVLADGRLASGARDASVRVWDVSARACVATLVGCRGDVTALAVLADGRLASGGEDGSVRLWDVGTAACVGVLVGHTNAITALAALPDGRLASGAHDRTIRLWTLRHDAGSRLAEGSATAIVLGHQVWRAIALVTLPDGRLASSDRACVRLWQPPMLVPVP